MKSKRVNIVQWLNRNMGGKWSYSFGRGWWCDDGKRHMAKVCMDTGCDCCDRCQWPGYFVYGGDKGTERIYPFHSVSHPAAERGKVSE